MNKNSYVTCECGEKVYRNKEGNYVCKKCGKKVKPKSKGWSA